MSPGSFYFRREDPQNLCRTDHDCQHDEQSWALFRRDVDRLYRLRIFLPVKPMENNRFRSSSEHGYPPPAHNSNPSDKTDSEPSEAAWWYTSFHETEEKEQKEQNQVQRE